MDFTNLYLLGTKVPKTPGVYAILNAWTSECYIGSTSNFRNRKNHHIGLLRNNKHLAKSLQDNWSSCEEQLIFVFLEEVEDKETRLDREQWWINSVNSSFNTHKDARSRKNTPHSQEARDKIRDHRIGKTLSDFSKKLVGAAQKNKIVSTETRAKLAAASTGKIVSEETRLKLSDKSKNRAQKETSKKLIAAAHNIAISQYTIDGVFVVDWESALQAALTLGLNNSFISRCVKGRCKTAYGFIWKKNIVKK